jgi:DNA-binding YbaB/EbfC family protein
MDIQFLMRQAKKIEKAVEQAKAQLAELEVDAESGGGLVQVKMDGRFEVKRITIDPKAVDPAGKEMLEDLIAAAVNAAMEKARKLSDETMEKATGGLRIPGLGA